MHRNVIRPFGVHLPSVADEVQAVSIVCSHGLRRCLTFVSGQKRCAVQEQDFSLRLAKLVGWCALAMAADVGSPWLGSAMAKRGHRLRQAPCAIERLSRS